MKHISNIYDPKRDNARSHFIYTSRDYRQHPKEWEQYLAWVNQYIIATPQATDSYTVAQLEGWGMVGLYAMEDSDE